MYYLFNAVLQMYCLILFMNLNTNCLEKQLKLKLAVPTENYSTNHRTEMEALCTVASTVAKNPVRIT